MGVFTKKKVAGDDEDLFASAVVNLNDPTQVEKFRAVVNASKIREGGYWDWYDRIWAYAWQHFVDHEHGAWYRILGPDNRKLSDEKSPAGKTDYHTMGACQDVLAALGVAPPTQETA